MMFRRFLFASILLCLVAGCVKQETIVTAFTFTSNGAQISGNVYTATYKRDSATARQVLLAKLYLDTKDYIQIHYSDSSYITPGTYNNGGILSYTASDSIVYDLTSGNLTISQIDTVAHKISGTFQFTGFNPYASPISVSFSNGSFNSLVYQTH